MRLTYTAWTLILLGTVVVAQEQSLFNGKDLTGWDGKPGWWRVKDGALTSESTPEKPCKKCNYLIWKGGEPGDFELTLDFKLSGKGNSGIQIRSERRPDWDTYGYQADMDGNGKLVGYVYHHKRGLIAARGQKVNITADGKKEVAQIEDSAKLKAVYKPEEWNHYRIVCQGPDITLYINGILMCRITDNDRKTAKTNGIIALQMHPGPPMKVQFKNIVLKKLTSAKTTGREGQLIAVLKSGAGHKDKSDACRELGRIGTAACVPALAALLTDEKLSHMARYGLEPIRCAAADVALRSALDQLKGRQLAGLVSTIGLRGDEKAVGALTGLLKDADASVAQEAARALGRIGGAEAAKGLQAALAGARGANRAAVCDGLFNCAEGFAAKRQNDQAVPIYDALRALLGCSRQVKAGALRGAVLARGKQGLPLLAESMRSADGDTVLAAARTAIEIKQPDVAIVLAGEIGKLPVDRQVLVAEILGKRGDAKALPALLALSKAGDTSVRVASLKAAAEIGGTGTIAPLMELLKDPNAQVAKAAAAALAGLRGAEVDEAVAKMLKSPDPGYQVNMVNMVARRRILSAMPVLADLMKEKNDAVRIAAIQSYGQLAGPEHLPQLLERIVSNTNTGDINALGKAITSICAAGQDPEACTRQLVPALGKAGRPAKPTLLKALRQAGGPEALKAVRGAVADPDKEVHATAIRSIGEWPTPDAIPVLLDLAKTSDQDVDKILCLRGYLGMAMKKQVSPQDKLAICREAVPLIRRDDEKRMLLGALSGLGNPESFPLVTPYLDDPAVKRDAVATVMTILKRAGKKGHTPAAKKALQKVIQVSADNPAMVKQAKGLLKRMGGGT